jgi:cytochrome bd-type quinol oxidase subunit 1
MLAVNVPLALSVVLAVSVVLAGWPLAAQGRDPLCVVSEARCRRRVHAACYQCHARLAATNRRRHR